MGEPYDGGDCPFCGSNQTATWTSNSAYLIGYGASCHACGTRWNFPYASDYDELVRIARNLARPYPPPGITDTASSTATTTDGTGPTGSRP